MGKLKEAKGREKDAILKDAFCLLKRLGLIEEDKDGKLFVPDSGKNLSQEDIAKLILEELEKGDE